MKNLQILIILLTVANWGHSQSKSAKFHQLFSSLYQEQAFQGNVLIAEKGEIIFEKSYGLADEAAQKKLTKHSIFDLASVSKQFTAMGIVLLQKQGKINYDDLIQKYLPELSFYEGITIKHLLIHTSGLPDYMALMHKHWDKTKFATNQDMIELLAKHKPALLFKPHEKWRYSNTGYALLATIIARVSGQSFGQFLKQNLFTPLKMTHTFVYRRRFAPQKIKNSTHGYIYSRKLKKKILPDQLGKNYYNIYLDGIVGDGMVNSTTRDLLKWDQALYTNQLVSSKDKQLIFASYITQLNKKTGYGFGWMINNNKLYGKYVMHNGHWAGYLTHIERHLTHDKTIIILQNNDSPKIQIPASAVRKILYNLPLYKKIELPLQVLKTYAGKYKHTSGKVKKIILENDKLYAVRNPQLKFELQPVAKGKFLIKGFSPEVTYHFLLNQQKEVIKYKITQPETGLNIEGIRIE